MSEQKDNETNKNDRIQALLSGGAEIAGAAVGGALGFLADGSISAAVLGAGGAAVPKGWCHILHSEYMRLYLTRKSFSFCILPRMDLKM